MTMTSRTEPGAVTVMIPSLPLDRLRLWMQEAVATDDWIGERTVRIVRAKSILLDPPIYLTLSYDMAKQVAESDITPKTLRETLTDAVAEERERTIEARKEAYINARRID